MFREFLLRQSIAEIEHQVRVEDEDFVACDAAVDAVENQALDIVAEIVILVFLPEVTVDADEEAILLAEGVIEAADRAPVIFERLAGEEEVVAAIVSAGAVRQRIKIQNLPS